MNKKGLGSLGMYILLIFSIGIVVFLMGDGGGMLNSMASASLSNVSLINSSSSNENTVLSSPDIGQLMINAIMSVFTNPIYLTAIGTAAVVGFIIGGSSFAIFFIVPAIMISIISRIFINPTSYLYALTSGIPYPGNLIVILFFMIMLILAIISFVKGGDV